MKKILILINETGVPHHVVDFIAQLSKREKYTIHGLFVGKLQPGNDSYSFPNDMNLTDTDFTAETDIQEAERLQQSQMKVFEDICKAANLDYHIKSIRENMSDAIVDETAFADLVLCDISMRDWQFSMINFISSAHCPVLLVPKDAPFFNEIIFTYDGGISSIHAMRQFTYIFPWCKDHKAYVVSVLPINVQYMEYDALVREWVSLHYSNAEIVILKGELKSEIAEFVNTGKNNMVVMGAFGRSSLSRLFKESLALAIMERTNVPIFIAHL